MTATLSLNHLARMSAEGMLNCMLDGIVIGLFAWVLLRVVGQRNSSTRFAVWFSALLAIAALPVLGVAASSPAHEGRVASITVPSSWAFEIVIVWAAIAGVLLLRVAIGFLQVRRLRAGCTAINIVALDPLLQATWQRFQATRPMELCQSDRLHVPTAIGFRKPMVLIPSWAMQELSTAELNAILIHELTHLRRRDDWTNLAQQVLKALLFFHPAVWWIEGQLALEREMACDDAVLTETADPRGYAQCLVSMAEKTFMRRGLALAQAVVNRMRQTSLRVSQILDMNRSSATRVWKPALYSVAAFFVVCLVSLSHAPEFVTFQDQTQNPMPDASIAARPANAALTATSKFLDERAVATTVSFHPKSAGATTPLTVHHAASNRPATNPAAKTRLTRRTGAPQSSARLLQARFVEPDGRNLVQTPAPQAVFVVMQTTQSVEAGPVVWRITVWRLTILDSARETRIPVKQI